MPVLKVKDRNTGEVVEAKLDPDSLKKVSNHQYFIDKFSRKPFRDVKHGNQIKRYFLDRDILGCELNDGRIIRHKNNDPLDNRVDNLVEKRRIANSYTGYRWPHSVDSLVNFLDKRKGADEDLCSEFLAKADTKRFTRKRVDVLASPEEYDVYKEKGIDRVIKGVLHKYFGWSGILNLTKEIKILPEDRSVMAPVQEQKELGLQKKDVQIIVKEQIPIKEPSLENKTEMEYEYENSPAVTELELSMIQMKKQLNQLTFSGDDKILEILRDRRICPTELIIRVLQERGASAINFSSPR